jgi:hypothetical protein
MQFKEISHNIVTYFPLLIIRSGNSTNSSGKVEESVQQSTGNAAELQLEQTQALIKSAPYPVILFCINQSLNRSFYSFVNWDLTALNALVL